MYHYGEIKEWPDWIEGLTRINHVLLAFNSSINIVIYTVKVQLRISRCIWIPCEEIMMSEKVSEPFIKNARNIFQKFNIYSVDHIITACQHLQLTCAVEKKHIESCVCRRLLFIMSILIFCGLSDPLDTMRCLFVSFWFINIPQAFSVDQYKYRNICYLCS